MAWQKCPICEGTGIVFCNSGLTSEPTKKCPVCDGQLIISDITGQPPVPPMITTNSPKVTLDYPNNCYMRYERK